MEFRLSITDKSINQIDVAAFLKKSKNDTFVRVIHWEKINACKLVEDLESYSLLREQVSDVNRTLKGMLHKCPYKSFDVDGITLSFGKTPNKDTPPTIYPDGYAKVNLDFRNRKKYLGIIQWLIEQKLFT